MAPSQVAGKHDFVAKVRPNLSPWLLQLPGELSTLGTVCNSLALCCRIALRYSVELASMPFPGQNISHQKKNRLLKHQFCAFLFVRRESPSDMKIICWHLATLCAWSRHVTITVTSVACGGQGNSKHVILCLGRRRPPLQIGL